MSEKIVIADDEVYILYVLAIKLRNAEYEVLTASDGSEALELCLAEPPNLIIADYQMPGMNGLELCREYHRLTRRRVPAMLITAREFDVDDSLLAESSVEAVVAKPFSPRQVVRTVGRLLNSNKCEMNVV